MQTKAIGPEAWEKLFSLNSDMSSYLVQSEDLDREETRRLSDKVRGHARLTLETLHQVRRGRSRSWV